MSDWISLGVLASWVPSSLVDGHLTPNGLPTTPQPRSRCMTGCVAACPRLTPQRNLYELYHLIYGSAVPDLPALLPEVWLHGDPKTVRSRGPQALLRHRMDFLLLLPHGERIVLEVDGSQHFTRPDGHSDTAKYANTMRGDRDLKLSGYEVFRFGATELLEPERARALLTQFFADLFRRFDVTSAHEM